MSGKTWIDGVQRNLSTGKCFVDGVQCNISVGKTWIDGVQKEIYSSGVVYKKYSLSLNYYFDKTKVMKSRYLSSNDYQANYASGAYYLYMPRSQTDPYYIQMVNNKFQVTGKDLVSYNYNPTAYEKLWNVGIGELVCSNSPLDFSALIYNGGGADYLWKVTYRKTGYEDQFIDSNVGNVATQYLEITAIPLIVQTISTYIADVRLKYGSVPANGVHTDGYHYVLQEAPYNRYTLTVQQTGNFSPIATTTRYKAQKASFNADQWRLIDPVSTSEMSVGDLFINISVTGNTAVRGRNVYQVTAIEGGKISYRRFDGIKQKTLVDTIIQPVDNGTDKCILSDGYYYELKL